MRQDDARTLELVARLGLTPGAVLGSGVEGVVVALDDATVAKVWSGRSRSDLELLRGFLAAVDATRPSGSPVAMPLVLDLLEVDDILVTVERRLAGDPVWRADGSSPDLTTGRVDAMTEALAALASVPPGPGLGLLPPLPDEVAPPVDVPFELRLADLVERRVGRFEAALGAALDDVAGLAASTVAALRALVPAPATLVHGDLIAANVLVAGGRATAVIDFGFLTTVGDPAFDAAVAASCFDMWGPRARDVERALDAAFVAAFAHDPGRIATYRAAYALVTACCFGTDLSEGHFAWCVALLDRDDVRTAVSDRRR